jgi:hypothetical protein
VAVACRPIPDTYNGDEWDGVVTGRYGSVWGYRIAYCPARGWGAYFRGGSEGFRPFSDPGRATPDSAVSVLRAKFQSRMKMLGMPENGPPITFVEEPASWAWTATEDPAAPGTYSDMRVNPRTMRAARPWRHRGDVNGWLRWDLAHRAALCQMENA